jgi:predicted kinase
MAATVHLITGSTGAGKTTYAIALAEKLGGVRFSIDEWMTTLFWMDSPKPIEFEWTMARIARCESQIWEQVKCLAALGVPVVLDLGFTRADHRTKFAALASGVGAKVQLHWLDIPAEERWQRVLQRNHKKGDTFSMEVDRVMFDFMEGQWHAPTEAEMRAMNGATV